MNIPISGKLAIVAVCLIVAIAMVVMRSKPPVLSKSFYFDLSKNELVTGAQVDATAAPTNPNLVNVRVYACGACSPTSWKVHFISKLTDEGRAAMARLVDMGNEDARLQRERDLTAGTLVAKPPSSGTAPQWVSAAAQAGMAIMQWPDDICPNGPATVCQP